VPDTEKDIEIRLQGLEFWRDGNGARGAEERLQTVEDTYVRTDQIPEVVRTSLQMIREREEEKERKSWNKWINTGMLAVMIAGQIIVLVQIY